MSARCLFVLYIVTSWIHHTRSHNHDGTGNKMHKCSAHHHKIIKGVNLFQQQVSYRNHPYSKQFQSNSREHDRRSLLSQGEVSPIRVSAYYDPITFGNALSAEQQSYVKKLIGAVTDYYKKAVSVIPVDGALLIDRICSNWWETSFGDVCFKYHPSKCFDTSIPSAHLSEQYLFDDAGGRTLLPGGSGISDTDLVLYITANFSSHDCGSSTLAAGGPCIYDQYGRPIAGNINICSNLFDEMVWKSDVNTLLHEMTHVTVMIESLWSDFRDSSGDKIPLDQVLNTAVSPKQIITPTVVSKVRAHFNCPTATGLPLDVHGTSHWNQQYLFSEVMNPVTLSPQNYYSQFTLALMQDSGWYIVNYQYAEPYAFGRNARCTFFTQDCIDKETHSSRFPQYFCHSFADNGCNADHSASSHCYYKGHELDSIPVEYQYFADPNEGGADFSNFCPWRNPYSNAVVCWDLSVNLDDDPYEVWKSTSRCATIRDTASGFNHGHCFNHKCYGWNGTHYGGVVIQFGTAESIQCTRSDARSTKTLTSVIDKEINCPNIDNVCGTSSHFGSCYWGHYSETEGECLCSPAYTGSDCNARNDDVEDMTHEISIQLTQSTFTIPTSVCFQYWDDFLPQWNGVWSKENTYYDLGIYQKGKYMMYFNAKMASWVIATEISDSLYCKCNVSLYTQDIGKCSGNWYCYNGQWTKYQNFQTHYGDCTEISLQTGRKDADKDGVTAVGVVLGSMLCFVLMICIVWCCYMIRKRTKLKQESGLLSEQIMNDKEENVDEDTQQIYIPPKSKRK